jgi:hypothetical protein
MMGKPVTRCFRQPDSSEMTVLKAIAESAFATRQKLGGRGSFGHHTLSSRCLKLSGLG